MATGDITATITECTNPTAIKTYLDTQSTGAATAGADTSSYQVVQMNNGSFIIVQIARAA